MVINMFGTNTIKSGLTFGKVLNGISKTLSVANQVIPLYQQAMPMINNAKTIFSVLKKLKSENNNKESKTTDISNLSPKEKIQKNIFRKENNNNPVFFQ